MNWIYLNREICPGSSFNISPENRAFRFADGCFESIRIMEALPVFWNKHMERLLETAAFLQIQLPIPTEKILEIAKELIHRNEIQLGGKIRIMLFRSGGGKYLPNSNEGELFIEAKSKDLNYFSDEFEPKKLGIEMDLVFGSSPLGNHKLINKTANVLASIHARDLGFQDLVLFNERSEVVETLSSNLFLLKGNDLATPPLLSGCLNGVIRGILIENSDHFNLKVKESTLFQKDLVTAEEIWTTNTSNGITPIKTFGGKTLSTNRASAAQKSLIDLAVNSTMDLSES